MLNRVFFDSEIIKFIWVMNYIKSQKIIILYYIGGGKVKIDVTLTFIEMEVLTEYTYI